MNYSSLPYSLRKSLAALPTPFFVFDLDSVAAKYDLLRSTLDVDRIFFAVKSNSLVPILKTLAERGCGLEVNNLVELARAEAAGGHPEEMINSSPICPASDVRGMYTRGVSLFAVDSKAQVDNLAINAPGARVYIRLFTSNDHSDFDLSKKFGVTSDQIPDLIKYVEKSGLVAYGLTFHVGSQCVSLNNWTEGLRETGRLFAQFPSLKMLNMGGGFPIKYTEEVPNISEIADTINSSVDRYFTRKPYLCVEPGRFLVGDSGLAVASVLQVEEKQPISRAIVDISIFTGLFEILENGQGFGYALETDAVDESHRYAVGGPTCAGADILAPDITLPRLKADYADPFRSSRIFVQAAGAYTIDHVSPETGYGFNCAKLPRTYLIQNGELLENNTMDMPESTLEPVRYSRVAPSLVAR